MTKERMIKIKYVFQKLVRKSAKKCVGKYTEVTRVDLASVFSVVGRKRLKYSLQPLVDYPVIFSLVEYSCIIHFFNALEKVRQPNIPTLSIVH
jgi:hypothetical protein